MSNLQDKINEARDNNEKLVNNAINDIERQTYYLRTDYDRLTIDRSTKDSRRDAALKILERVRNGEIEKVDEDDIYNVHHNIDTKQENSNNQYEDLNKDLNKDSLSNTNDSHQKELKVEEKEVQFDELTAIDRLKVISKLINNDDQKDVQSDDNLEPEDLMVDKNKVFNNESNFDSSETNYEALNDNKNQDLNQISNKRNKNIESDKSDYDKEYEEIEDFEEPDEFEESENIENNTIHKDENSDETEKKPGFFKKIMNKLFGGK